MRAWWWLGLVACATDELPDGALPPPALALGATVAGGAVTVSVSGAAPGEMVQLAGSRIGPGPGPCPPALGGTCFDVLGPARVGGWRADASGQVVVRLPLPPTFTQGWLQAVALRAGAAAAESNVAAVGVSTTPRVLADLLPGDLVITEILQNPAATGDTEGEWFEVYNPGSSPIDLQGLVVHDLGQDTFTVRSALSVPARGYVVFGANGDPSRNGGARVDYVWSGFSLGNGDDEVILSGPGGVLDEVDYDGGPAFPDPNGASMTLSSTAYSAAANDASTAWCEAVDAMTGGDLGSPGADNIDCGTGTGGGPITPPVNPGVDLDLDGSGASTDCDEHDPRVFPGAAEVCDGIDDDCDGHLGPGEADGDGDGMPD
ncbi:MAG TPA: lamin tail domain-containing protein, partial [Myxococcota bacterium]|nr:lamin tail domain-containing protein [Myxococcota bacterium]